MQRLGAGLCVVLLSLSLLSACARSDAPHSSGAGSDMMQSGVLGNYLAGRFALSEGDASTASQDLLKAAAERPNDPELAEQALIATLLTGQPEAVELASRLPDNQFSGLVLANVDVKSGQWSSAEQNFRKLPRHGMTQLLQPLLVAWAQLGDGRPDAALSTLHPYFEGPGFRSIFLANAAIIADLGNRPEESAQLYHALETGMTEPNLRLSQAVASWESRSGHSVDAQRTLASLANAEIDMSIAMPALLAKVNQRVVATLSDGIAETYFMFAAALHTQDMNPFSLIILRMALGLRPNYPAACLLMADILTAQQHPAMALAVLTDVPASDPIYPVVELRRAALLETLGRSTEAMRSLQRLSDHYPFSPLPDAQRGDILGSNKRHPEAIQAYNKAISRIVTPSPTNWILFYARGVAEDQAKQWPKAEGDLQRALDLAPNQPFVLNYLGYSWANSGHHLDKARQMIEAAALARPNDGAIIDSLGWIQFRQGDVAAAVKTLERAVELEPEEPTINGHLGDAYWAANRKLEADYQWRRALILNPAPADAAKLEAKLNAEPTGRFLSGQ
ncbi:MAG: tetratricopeptide repeat protein [Rhodopila sp.]